MIGGPGLWESTEGAAGFGGIVVTAHAGDTDGVQQAIERTFPDREYSIAPFIGPDQLEPLREAIRYEAGGVLVFAGLAGLAAIVFTGQAVARQSRREWLDRSALRALGLSNRQAGAAAAIRGGIIGGLAAVVAVATAVALSPLGSFGVARNAEVDPGVHPMAWS